MENMTPTERTDVPTAETVTGQPVPCREHDWVNHVHTFCAECGVTAKEWAEQREVGDWENEGGR